MREDPRERGEAEERFLIERVNSMGFDHCRLQVLGYDVPAWAALPSHPGLRFDPKVPVTSTLEDPALQRYFKDGGSVILMICKEANCWERGPIAWPFYKVWPNNSMSGWRSDHGQDTLAGVYAKLSRSVPIETSGKPQWSEVSGTLVRGRCAKGRLIISTFELVTRCPDDPVSALMLNDTIQYATTPFQPAREFVLS
jgi:hypothetical protein